MSQLPEVTASDVIGVSDLVALLRETFEDAFSDLWVEGEVGSLHRSRPGHLYFDLKDEAAQLRCAMFRGAASRLEFELEDGMRIRVHAKVDLYPERGSLQLIVSRVQAAGEGALRLAFERLKARLAEEGLFDPAHKQAIPEEPRRIGLVTSLQGAAVHDFLRALKVRQADADVLAVDARVQGEEAWREIVRGLHLLDAQPEVDVIVLTRGGGSLEDLWTFNREEVVRCLFELQTPVISAIGHEVDFVLTDAVADMRAPTPTAAAALVAPDGAALHQRLLALGERLQRAQHARLRDARQRLAVLRVGLAQPARAFRAQLNTLSAKLNALSPLAVMGRGFSIASRESDGQVLQSATDVSVGDEVGIRLLRGRLRTAVVAVQESE